MQPLSEHSATAARFRIRVLELEGDGPGIALRLASAGLTGLAGIVPIARSPGTTPGGRRSRA